MEAIRVLVAMGNENLIDKVRMLLQEQGYNVVDTAVDGNECLRKARTLKLDLAVVDFDVTSLTGAKVTRFLVEDGICDVILIAGGIQRGLIGDLQNYDEVSILDKPLNKSILLNTLEIMSKSIRRSAALKEEISGLKDTIEARKAIEKAKGILMSLQNVTEDEAFKLIQRESMKSRKSMKDVAYSVIENKSI